MHLYYLVQIKLQIFSEVNKVTYKIIVATERICESEWRLASHRSEQVETLGELGYPCNPGAEVTRERGLDLSSSLR